MGAFLQPDYVSSLNFLLLINRYHIQPYIANTIVDKNSEKVIFSKALPNYKISCAKALISIYVTTWHKESNKILFQHSSSPFLDFHSPPKRALRQGRGNI